MDAISPQEIPLTTEDIDLLLRRMTQITVECDLNPFLTHPKSKKYKRRKQTIFGTLLNLRGGQLSALGMDVETYVLDTPPIILRYGKAIEDVTTDMRGFVALCEDELRNENAAKKC